ncbi:MAG: 3-deoxy-D-manno-octulosonic acid transferase [Weeksellaceae bacterium]
MQLLYNIFTYLYQIGFKGFSLWNPKAKLGIEGRKDWRKNLKNAIDAQGGSWIWMHCSSLGEFEQGRPVLEALKKQYPYYNYALSFFSPSGYEVIKNYKESDIVFYLPLDTPQNARDLARIIQPKLWILSKYDYWYNHLKEQHKIGTKIIVVSAIFRPSHIYFKSYGNWFAKNLKQYIHHFFVQDKASKDLLKSIDISQVTIAGDTRFDRVKSIAKHTIPLIWVEKFKIDHKLIVIGSSWKEDETLWIDFINNQLPNDWKVIIAPHEIKSSKIQNLKESLKGATLLFSDLKIELDKEKIPATLLKNARVIIVDVIGLLSTIYASADLAYVGGGFNKSGVHNTLEPTVFGTPTVIGPNFEKFNEVKLLKQEGIIFPIYDAASFNETVTMLMQNSDKRNAIAQKANQFFENQPKSTALILNYLNQNNIL